MTTTYSPDACAPSAVLLCWFRAGAEGIEHDTTVSYYASLWDVETAGEACSAAGGTSL